MMKLDSVIVVSLIMILCSLQVEARPDGATILACDTLIPDHGINQIGNDPFPYKVDLSDFTLPPFGSDSGYRGGKKYYIRLSGTSKDRNFRGFLIQARTVGDNSSVGTFSRRVSNKPVCNNDTAATHVNNRQKEYVILHWTAPPTDTGPIRFWYSFVDINRKYRVRHWGAERSRVIQEVPECSIEGQVYTTCGTACPPTCKYDPSGCIQQCFVGCQCPRGTVLDEANNRCVKKEYCECQVQGQLKKECGIDPRCATTCTNRVNRLMSISCSPAACVFNGCECPNGTVIDEESKRCVLPSECPKIPLCPIKGQYYTADCLVTNATCNDPNPVPRCDYPRCVCPRGQVIDEATNACINGTECPNICKFNKISGSVHSNKKKSKLFLEFSAKYEGNSVIFECKLDNQEYSPCTSPKVWRILKLNAKRHVITVKATCIYNNNPVSTMSKRFRFKI